jgi:hypothetical protein
MYRLTLDIYTDLYSVAYRQPSGRSRRIFAHLKSGDFFFIFIYLFIFLFIFFYLFIYLFFFTYFFFFFFFYRPAAGRGRRTSWIFEKFEVFFFFFCLGVITFILLFQLGC